MKKKLSLDWEIIVGAYGGLALFAFGVFMKFGYEIACIITGIILMATGYGGGLLEQILTYKLNVAEIQAHVKRRK